MKSLKINNPLAVNSIVLTLIIFISQSFFITTKILAQNYSLKKIYGEYQFPISIYTMTKDGFGNIYIFDDFLQVIFKYNPSLELIKLIQIRNNKSPEFNGKLVYPLRNGFAVSENGNFGYMLVPNINSTNPNTNSILKFDLLNGSFVKTIGKGIIISPTGIALKGNGLILVSSSKEEMNLIEFDTDGNYLGKSTELIISGKLNLRAYKNGNALFLNQEYITSTNSTIIGLTIYKNSEMKNFQLGTYGNGNFINNLQLNFENEDILYTYTLNNLFYFFRYRLQNNNLELIENRTYPFSSNYLILDNNRILNFLKGVESNNIYYYPIFQVIDADGNLVFQVSQKTLQKSFFYPTNIEYINDELIVKEFITNNWKKYSSQLNSLVDTTFNGIGCVKGIDFYFQLVNDGNNQNEYVLEKRNLATGNIINEMPLSEPLRSWNPFPDLFIDETNNRILLRRTFHTNGELTNAKVEAYNLNTLQFEGVIIDTNVERLISDFIVRDDGKILGINKVNNKIEIFNSNGTFIGFFAEQFNFDSPKQLYTNGNDVLVIDASLNHIPIFDLMGSIKGVIPSSAEYTFNDKTISQILFQGNDVLIVEPTEQRVLHFTIPPFKIYSSSYNSNVNGLVDVSLRNINLTNLTALQFTLEWDPAVATYNGFVASALPGFGNANLGTQDVANGKLYVSWSSPNLTPVTLPDDTELINLSFTATGNPGASTTLSFTNVELIGLNNTVLPHTTENGSITINNEITVSGSITHRSNPLSDVAVQLNQSLQTATQANGSYSQTMNWNDTYTLVPSKEANANTYSQNLNAADLAYYQQVLLQQTSTSDALQLKALDVSNNQQVSIQDKTITESVILGLIDGFPNRAAWQFVPANFTGSHAFEYPPAPQFTQPTNHITQNFHAIHLGDVVSNEINTRTKDGYSLQYVLQEEKTDNQSNYYLTIQADVLPDVSALQGSITLPEGMTINIKDNPKQVQTNATTNSIKWVWVQEEGQATMLTKGTTFFTLKLNSEPPIEKTKLISELSSGTSLANLAVDGNLQSSVYQYSITEEIKGDEEGWYISLPFPNPQHKETESLYVNVKQPQGTTLTMRLTTVQGQQVKETKFTLNGTDERITLTEKPNKGIYLIELSTNTGQKKVSKLVVE